MNLIKTKPTVSYFSLGTAIATPETTNVKVCSNTGTSYILPPLPGNLRESNVTVIDVSWSRRNVSSNKWTVVLHWHHSNGCHMSTNSWAFGTRIQCSSEGKLIVDLMEGRHPGTFAHYLVEGRLSDSSHVHHFYKVEFIECKHGLHLNKYSLEKGKKIFAFHLKAPKGMRQVYESPGTNTFSRNVLIY